MSDRSAIEWTGATWNPVTGCDRVSPGCDHCYAMTLAKRLKAMGSDKYQTDGDPRTSGPGFGVTIHPRSLDEPFRWRSPRTVFVNSMADLFHARVALWFIREVFEVMRATPQHTYQILTKRSLRLRRLAHKLEWPSNVWMGVSVENVDAFRRIEDLRQVPAAVRFLSCEPLLGPLDGINLGSIDWVIAGGESGPNFRRSIHNGFAIFAIPVLPLMSHSSSSNGAVEHQRHLDVNSTDVVGMKCRLLRLETRILGPPAACTRIPCWRRRPQNLPSVRILDS